MHLASLYHQTVLLEAIEQRSDVLQMLFVAAAGDQDVVQIHENATKASAKPCPSVAEKACAAFLRPNGIRRNSYRPNGVMMAVLAMLLWWTGI